MPDPATSFANSRYFRPVSPKETRIHKWDQQFESCSLQRRVGWEPDFVRHAPGAVRRDPRSLVARVLRRLRVACGVGVVLGHCGDQRADDERSQIRLERVRDRLCVDFLAFDIEREGFDVFFLLGAILDRGLGPRVERILFRAVLFSVSNIVREGVELTFQRRVVLGQDGRQRRYRGIAGIAPRGLPRRRRE